MKFRKKQVVVEATQWFKMGDHPAVTHALPAFGEGMGWVKTLEGGHVVTPGDWIITGVKGEHYPCKPDIFAATYESVPEDSSMNENDKKLSVPYFLKLTIQEKSKGEDYRAFLEWADREAMLVYEIRGYGSTPVAACEDACFKYNEDAWWYSEYVCKWE